LIGQERHSGHGGERQGKRSDDDHRAPRRDGPRPRGRTVSAPAAQLQITASSEHRHRCSSSQATGSACLSSARTTGTVRWAGRFAGHPTARNYASEGKASIAPSEFRFFRPRQCFPSNSLACSIVAWALARPRREEWGAVLARSQSLPPQTAPFKAAVGTPSSPRPGESRAARRAPSGGPRRPR